MLIIIFGAGPAGAATGIAAREFGADVVLIGRQQPQGPRSGESISPEAVSFLHRLGVYELLCEHHLRAPGIVSVWEDDQIRENDSIFNPYGEGWHLDRCLFDRQLVEVAKRREVRVVDFFKPCQVLRARDDDAWIVSVDSGVAKEEFVADFVIDATGRAAWLARQLDCRRNNFDRLIGIVGFLDTAIDDDPRTFLEAVDDGWLYFANLPNKTLVAAFMTDSDIAMKHDGGLAKLWYDRLRDSRCGRFINHSEHVVFRILPAHTSRLNQFAGPGWAAVGDAAATWDPLSSQGISTALEAGIRAMTELFENDDPRQELHGYAAWLEELWRTYAKSYAYFYGLPRRWPDSIFWRRRQDQFNSMFTGEALIR